MVTDSKLLMPEIVESGQTEFDECHFAKLSGAMDIQQSSVSSSPDATNSFNRPCHLHRDLYTPRLADHHKVSCSGNEGFEIYNC